MPTTAVSDVVHVAVGILTDRERIFVTRRLPNTHLAGKWEFPGGKVHAGETVVAALRRELHEELGIEVGTVHPLMQVQHRYPEKAVLLDVWSVRDYVGTPHGREGQEARWATPAELLTLEFPAADLPIQRRLWLPTLYAISDCARYGQSDFMRRLELALARGLRLLQLREPEMGQTEYLALAREVIAPCHSFGAKVLLNADPAWVEVCGADGVHLNSRRLMQAHERPLSGIRLVAASCHDAIELARAAEIGVDAVVLGPVAATPTHAGATPLGWDGFKRVSAGARLAVYALGGMRPTDLARACGLGAHGLAMIRGLWDAPDIGAAVAACVSG